MTKRLSLLISILIITVVFALYYFISHEGKKRNISLINSSDEVSREETTDNSGENALVEEYYGKEGMEALKKPIDKKFLTYYRGLSSVGVFWEDNLTLISEEEYNSAVDTSVDFSSETKELLTNTTITNECVVLDLEDNQKEYFCNDINGSYKYLGFDKNKNLHLLTFTSKSANLQENPIVVGDFTVNQRGERMDLGHWDRYRYSGDLSILVGYTERKNIPPYYTGISFMQFDFNESKYNSYGSYRWPVRGYHVWGVSEVKIDNQNNVYFKTISDSPRHKYSFFKQTLSKQSLDSNK